MHGMALDSSMSSDDLRRALDDLGISQVELGRRLGVAGQSVRRWVGPDGTVPGPVAVLVRLLQSRPELVTVVGFDPAPRIGRRARKPAGKAHGPR